MDKIFHILIFLFLSNVCLSQKNYSFDTIPYEQTELHTFANGKKLSKELVKSNDKKDGFDLGFYLNINSLNDEKRILSRQNNWMYSDGESDLECLWTYEDKSAAFLNNEYYILFDSLGNVVKVWTIRNFYFTENYFAIGTKSIDSTNSEVYTISILDHHQKLLKILYGDKFSKDGEYNVTYDYNVGFVFFDKNFNQLCQPILAHKITNFGNSFIVNCKFDKSYLNKSFLLNNKFERINTDTLIGQIEVIDNLFLVRNYDLYNSIHLYNEFGSNIDSGHTIQVFKENKIDKLCIYNSQHLSKYDSKNPIKIVSYNITEVLFYDTKKMLIRDSINQKLILLDGNRNEIAELKFEFRAKAFKYDEFYYLFKDGHWFLMDSCLSVFDTINVNEKFNYLDFKEFKNEKQVALKSISIPAEVPQSYADLGEFSQYKLWGRNKLLTSEYNSRFDYLISLENKKIIKVFDRYKIYHQIINSSNLNEHLSVNFLDSEMEKFIKYPIDKMFFKPISINFYSVSENLLNYNCNLEFEIIVLGTEGELTSQRINYNMVLRFVDDSLKRAFPGMNTYNANDNDSDPTYFSPNGHHIVLWNNTGNIYFYNLESGSIKVSEFQSYSINNYCEGYYGFWGDNSDKYFLICEGDTTIVIDLKRDTVIKYKNKLQEYDSLFFQLNSNKYGVYSRDFKYRIYTNMDIGYKMMSGVHNENYPVFVFDLEANQFIDTFIIKDNDNLPDFWTCLDFDIKTNSILVGFDYKINTIKKIDFNFSVTKYHFFENNEYYFGLLNLESNTFKTFIDYLNPISIMLIDSSSVFVNAIEDNWLVRGFDHNSPPWIFNADEFSYKALNYGWFLPNIEGILNDNLILVDYEYNSIKDRNPSQLNGYIFDLTTLSFNLIPIINNSDEFASFRNSIHSDTLIRGKLRVEESESFNQRHYNIINIDTYDTLKLFLYKSLDWILVDKDENYYCSTGFENEIMEKEIINGKMIYTSDSKKYRPDIILSRLGLYEVSVMEKVDKLFAKTKKNVKTDNYSKEPISIIKLRVIDSHADYLFAELKIEFNSNSKFQDLLFYNNNVKMYRFNVKSHAISDNLHTLIIQVPIIDSKNKIHIEIYTSTDTLAGSITFDQAAKYFESNLYFIGIGTSEYDDASLNLKYTLNDINGVFNALKKSEHVKKAKKLLLLNNSITTENLDKVYTFLKKARPQDQIVFYLAGHGVLDNDMKFYYAPSNMDFHNPSKYGIQLENLIGLMDSSLCLRRMIFFDACHSGSIDEELLLEDLAKTENKDVKFRAVSAPLQSQNAIIHKLYQQLFGQFNGVNGTTIISASTGIEAALESVEWKHGLFSYSIINALLDRNGTNLDGDFQLTLDELYLKVRGEVNKLSDGRQNPEYYSVNKLVKYEF